MNKTGFGFLRLPHGPGGDKDIDYALLNRMVDTFLAEGGRYFDTAYTYLEGVSEEALRKSVVERYDREAYLIADKLPTWNLKEPADFFASRHIFALSMPSDSGACETSFPRTTSAKLSISAASPPECPCVFGKLCFSICPVLW